jgi:hypothetical protein
MEPDVVRAYEQFFDDFVDSRHLDPDPVSWPADVVKDWRDLYRAHGFAAL